MNIIDEISLLQNNINVEEVNYGGTGGIVIGIYGIILIVAVAGIVLVKAFIKRGRLLNVIIYTIQRVDLCTPGIVDNIRRQMDKEIKMSNITTKDKKNISNFAKKKGTFVKQK